MGYRDVLNTIHESNEYIPIRPSYILQLHRDSFEKGRILIRVASLRTFRTISMKQSRMVRWSQGLRRLRLLTRRLLWRKLCNAYEQAIANEKIDSLILIPTFICDFLCIHPFNDGNGRMSRLLTLLLLYKNGYSVGKYISIEKQIEKTKDRYYDTLEKSDAGWHEEKNDPTPFIRYMLQAILACYTEFEERVGLMTGSGNGSTAYDIVKKYTEGKIGKFRGADVVAHCST